MKIITHDSRQLILERKRGFNPFLVIWGLFFGGIPLFIFILFFKGLGVTNLNCKRMEISQVNCQINRTIFGGLKADKSHSLNNVITVKFAQIEDFDSDGEKTVDNQIILENKQGEQISIKDSMFVNGVRGNEQNMRKIESQVRLFLDGEKLSLSANYDNRWRWANLIIFVFLSIFIFIGGGVFVWDIISIGYEKTVFNKSTSKFSFETVNLLGKKHEIYSLRQINSIIIEEDKDSDGDKIYTLIIAIGHKKQYKLDRHYQINIIQTNADEIAKFLDMKVITHIK